jgi:hypothetical protein
VIPSSTPPAIIAKKIIALPWNPRSEAAVSKSIQGMLVAPVVGASPS